MSYKANLEGLQDSIELPKHDLVNHPNHYLNGNLEAIDVIDQFNLGFNLGNSIKYILRCEKKGNKKLDLEKAIWYLNRELSKFNG